MLWSKGAAKGLEDPPPIRVSDRPDNAHALNPAPPTPPPDPAWPGIGEVRGGEALDLIKVWGTGHPGGVATLHARSARGALLRLEQLILEVAMTPPRALIAEAVNVIVFIAGRGRARQVQTVARVTGFDGNGYQLDDALAPLPSPSSTHSGELP